MSHDDRIVLAQPQDEVQIAQKLATSIHCISSMPLQIAAGILMHCKKKEFRLNQDVEDSFVTFMG